jgi:diguanylate cyclase (GGDEF)-like protein
MNSRLDHSILRRFSDGAEEEPEALPVLALHRLRQLLGIECISLNSWNARGLQIEAQSGRKITSGSGFASLVQRVLQSDEPVVMPDTRIAGGVDQAPSPRLFIGIPITTATNRLVLCLSDRQPRPAELAYRMAMRAADIINRAVLARQSAQLAAATDEMSVLRQRFDQASHTARIGWWQCLLPSQKLTWSNGVYDLYEMERGIPLTRDMTLHFYTDESRQAMETARADAIAQGHEFRLDAEIITAKGNRRWMRLTGNVDYEDGVPVRIFGMKQDITDEKLLTERTRYLAAFDLMSGLANRSQFQDRLDDLDGVRHRSAIAALLLIDLDAFKQINDSFGHARGDDWIKEAAKRLRQCCAGAELVARIGGDEFAVVLGPNFTPEDAQAMAAAIVESLSVPVPGWGQDIRLGASVGVAFRGDNAPDDLFREADAALYAAKAAGRNTYRIFG